MRATLMALIAFGLSAGCGGAMYKSYDSSYEPAPAMDQGYYGGSDEGAMAYDTDYAFAEDASEMEMLDDMDGDMLRVSESPGASMSKSKVSKKSGSAQYQKKAEEPGSAQQSQNAGAGKNDGNKQNDLEAPMVVYTGYLKLRVKRLLEAVDEITTITEDQGGYIESLTREVIVVRVPAKDFDKVIATFTEIGELLERRIKALDVTEQFTDLGARLAVAREARSRLLVLLKKVEDVEERLRILQEIKRLSEQIESVESTLATLQNLVDYFTITIELQPVLDDTAPTMHRSPFSWVSNLSAHKTTLYDGQNEFEMKLPSEFVLFDKDDVYRAQAADTTVIRGAVVDNEPLGNNDFWSNAVHHEMLGRAEKLISEETAGPMQFRLYRSEDVQPRYYMVAVFARHEDLYVVEVFYPTEASYELHHEQVVESLSTFKVR